MSFVDNFYDFVDFTERVDVRLKRDGVFLTFELDRAALVSSRFSDADRDAPPRLVGVWRLPVDETTRSLRRGDQIRDVSSQIWIVSETSLSRPLQVVSCQCFCEQLFPEAGDFVDASRPLRSGGFQTLATQAPALVKRRQTERSREGAFPASTLVEEIEFWIQIQTLVRPGDLVTTSDGSLYETTSYRAPSNVSTWGVLVARRLGGVDDAWSVPKTS